MARRSDAQRPSPPMPNAAYDRDLVLWAEEQVRFIQAGAFHRLDLDHLAEEIADVGGALRREVESRTQTLVEHLLKLRASPAVEPRKKWEDTVRRTRIELERCLRQAPSLRRSLPSVLAEVSPDALDLAARSLDDAGEIQAAALLRRHGAALSPDQVFGSWIPDDRGS